MEEKAQASMEMLLLVGGAVTMAAAIGLILKANAQRILDAIQGKAQEL